MSEMTPRERVRCAFDFRKPDRPPYTLWYGDGVPERVTEHLGSDAWQQQVTDHIVRITIDWEPKEPLDDEHFRDVYGAIWRRGNPLHLVEPPLKTPSLAGYEIPDLVPHIDVEPLRAQLEAEVDRKFLVLGYGFGAFERAWMLRGYENFCMDLYDAPEFVKALLDQLTETHLPILDRLAEVPCDGIIFSDDFGDQRGVIVGPDRWRELVRPCYEKLYDRVHQLGKMTLQHSCGNVADIAGDLADAGLDVLQCLQPEAMDPYELKRLHGHRLRFWGGLGTQGLLPYGTADQVRAEVRRLCAEMGRDGGYVFTTAKPIFAEVPVENAVAVIETLLELHDDSLQGTPRG